MKFEKADELANLWNTLEERILQVHPTEFEWNDFHIKRVTGKMRLTWKEKTLEAMKLVERMEATKYVKDFKIAIEADLEQFADELEYSIVRLKEVLK